MPTAVSSWREEMYSGASLLAHGAASASQSGAQSEPGEAKMRSTPIAASARSKAAAPVGRSLANIELRQQLPVVRVLRAYIGAELPRRHRLGDVHRERLEALEHCRLFHHALHFAVQAIQRLARRSGRCVKAEMRATIDALDAVLLERRHVRKARMPRRADDCHH